MYIFAPKPKPEAPELAPVDTINRYFEMSKKPYIASLVAKEAPKQVIRVKSIEIDDSVILSDEETQDLSAKATAWVAEMRAKMLKDMMK